MTTAQLKTRVPCTSGAPTTITGSRSADAATIVVDRRLDAVEQGVLEEQVVDGVAASATARGTPPRATPSSWHARACSSTISALRAGSAIATGTVQAATRANPWAYADQKSTPAL